MSLQWDINRFPVFEIPNKRKNRLLSSSCTEKMVYVPLQTHESFFHLLENQKRFFRLLFSGFFFSVVGKT